MNHQGLHSFETVCAPDAGVGSLQVGNICSPREVRHYRAILLRSFDHSPQAQSDWILCISSGLRHQGRGYYIGQNPLLFVCLLMFKACFLIHKSILGQIVACGEQCYVADAQQRND